MYQTDPSKLRPVVEFTPGNESAVSALRAEYEAEREALLGLIQEAADGWPRRGGFEAWNKRRMKHFRGQRGG